MPSSSRLVTAAAAGSVAAAAYIASRNLRTATVAGTSMDPTFKPGSSILVEARSATAEEDRGDVVVLHSPEEGCEDDLLTKRVVGLERDWLYARDGRLVRVPTAHVWVEGDNASNSNDSTHYGAVPRGTLVGTVVAKVWPLAEAGPVADRHEECEARVIPAEEARRLRSRKTETGETLRIALRASRDAMQEYIGRTPPDDKASGRPAGA